MMKHYTATAIFLSATLLMGCVPASTANTIEVPAIPSVSAVVIVPQPSSYTSSIETAETVTSIEVTGTVTATTSVEETVVTTDTSISETTAVTETAVSETVETVETSHRKMLNVVNIQQMPELPAGCEITSTTIALNYVLGTSVDKMDMISYMPCMPEPIDGIWDSPMNVFVGSPFSNKYGAYAPVIVKTLTSYFAMNNVENMTAIDLSGSELSSLYSYIDNGTPVIIWATIEMKEPEVGKTWLCQDGSSFTWTRNEHCMVLIGYDTIADTVIISDPWDPRGIVEIDRNLFESRYISLFQQAVVIEKKAE